MGQSGEPSRASPPGVLDAASANRLARGLLCATIAAVIPRGRRAESWEIASSFSWKGVRPVAVARSSAAQVAVPFPFPHSPGEVLSGPAFRRGTRQRWFLGKPFQSHVFQQRWRQPGIDRDNDPACTRGLSTALLHGLPRLVATGHRQSPRAQHGPSHVGLGDRPPHAPSNLLVLSPHIPLRACCLLV